jgi:serine protease Do
MCFTMEHMTHEEQIVTAVKKVMPAVVSITAAKDWEALQEAARKLAPLGFPFPEQPPGTEGGVPEGIPTTEDGKVRLGGGSGFIVDKSGVILTNRHVVADPEAEYTVILHDEQTYPLSVVANDPIHDVAILKIDAKGRSIPDLPIATLAEEKPLELGQTVIAGVISGLSRLIAAITDMSGKQERLRGLIQTDAAINPGNSGGPLIDLDGNVIGINVAIVFGAQNIGFAIPVKKAKRDLDDITKHGRIRRPFLGMRYVLLNKQIADRFSLPVSHGAYILKEAFPGDNAIIPGSAAEKAGLKEGDIIVTCNKKRITEKETLEDMLESMNVGDEVRFGVLVGGIRRQITSVRLEEHV